MDVEKLLYARFESETEKLKLLKEVKVNFKSIKISCSSMFVTNTSSLKKKGYLTIPLYNNLSDFIGPVVYYYKFDWNIPSWPIDQLELNLF